jgi:DNA primase
MPFTARFDSVHREDILTRSKRFLWKLGGKKGLDYLRVSRGLSDDTIRTYNLGYIPPEVDHQLAGRIIIPIFDPSGQLVVVSSRQVSEEDDSFLPVYWHERYEKSLFLFGLDVAKEAIRRERACIVVEGQFDVMRMYDSGIKNVVGACGSKLSIWQLAIILRYCPYVLLMFDRDTNYSGQKGMSKTTKELGVPDLNRRGCRSQAGYVLETVDLPENGDPDDLIQKHGADYLRVIIDNKLHLIREKYDVFFG